MKFPIKEDAMTLNPDTIGSLMVRVQDELTRPNGEFASGQMCRVEFMQLADGSHRTAALMHGTAVDAAGNENEKYLRISAPAPAHAPAWARREHDEWEIEEVQYA